MRDIQTPFRFLTYGCLISLAVFLIEKFVLPPEKLTKLKRRFRPVQSMKDDSKIHRQRKLKRNRVK